MSSPCGAAREGAQEALELAWEEGSVTVKVSDLMAQQVVTAEPHQTVEHVRRMIERNKIQAMCPDGASMVPNPRGIITKPVVRTG